MNNDYNKKKVDFFVGEGASIKLKSLHLIGKHSTIELHTPNPWGLASLFKTFFFFVFQLTGKLTTQKLLPFKKNSLSWWTCPQISAGLHRQAMNGILQHAHVSVTFSSLGNGAQHLRLKEGGLLWLTFFYSIVDWLQGRKGWEWRGWLCL